MPQQIEIDSFAVRQSNDILQRKATRLLLTKVKLLRRLHLSWPTPLSQNTQTLVGKKWLDMFVDMFGRRRLLLFFVCAGSWCNCSTGGAARAEEDTKKVFFNQYARERTFGRYAIRPTREPTAQRSNGNETTTTTIEKIKLKKASRRPTSNL